MTIKTTDSGQPCAPATASLNHLLYVPVSLAGILLVNIPRTDSITMIYTMRGTLALLEKCRRLLTLSKRTSFRLGLVLTIVRCLVWLARSGLPEMDTMPSYELEFLNTSRLPSTSRRITRQSRLEKNAEK